MPRLFETHLKIDGDGWTSGYASVQKMLGHYARKTKSESTRENVLSILDAFLTFAGDANLDLYVKNKKAPRSEAPAILHG
ncbi:MAG: hypothetical protein ACRECH_00960 [Nitrososphaerales archaeon]